MTDNAGATDEHRALNYLAVRYPAIYAKAAEAFAGRLFADGRGGPSLAVERHAQHRRGNLRVHQPQHGFHREVLCAGRCDRGVPVPGDEAVALL